LSRNRSRVGKQAPTDSAAPPPVSQGTGTEGFSFVVPTEFVELPSRGTLYPPGHPLHNEETIEIKQLTAKEEDMLTSRTLLKKGIAIERVLQSLIIDKSIHPDHLLVGDRNAIIIAARVSGYGNEYTTSVTCPSCGTKQAYAFDLNEADVYDGSDIDDLPDTTQRDDGTYTVTLPKLKAEVTFRLLTGIDEREFANVVDRKAKNGTHEKLVTDQLRRLIVSVNGSGDPQVVNYLVENMPSLDAKHLRLAYKLAAPNIDLSQHFECNECDFEQDMEVPLTADFFWPER